MAEYKCQKYHKLHVSRYIRRRLYYHQKILPLFLKVSLIIPHSMHMHILIIFHGNDSYMLYLTLCSQYVSYLGVSSICQHIFGNNRPLMYNFRIIG